MSKHFNADIKKFIDNHFSDDIGYLKLKVLYEENGRHHKVFCGEQMQRFGKLHPRVWDMIFARINLLESDLIIDYEVDLDYEFVHIVCKTFMTPTDQMVPSPPGFTKDQYVKDVIHRLKNYYPLCPIDYTGHNLCFQDNKSVFIDVEDIIFGISDNSTEQLIKNSVKSNIYHSFTDVEFDNLWNKYCIELDYKYVKPPLTATVEYKDLIIKNYSTL
jgi:hypothetical protein